jgi:hypothetical protein
VRVHPQAPEYRRGAGLYLLHIGLDSRIFVADLVQSTLPHCVCAIHIGIRDSFSPIRQSLASLLFLCVWRGSMMMKIGYKINGDWHTQAYPIAIQLPVSVVVNNLTLARALADAGKMVIHRFTHIGSQQDEGFSNWHKQMPPELYGQKLIDAHGNNTDIWMYVFNEPNVGNEADMRMFIAYAVRAFSYILSRGYKVVGANTPPASYPEKWVNAGVYDELIDFAHTNRDKFIIGYHDYSDYHLVRFGNDEKDYDQLDNPDYVKQSNWSTIIRSSTAWHLHHITRLIIRARERGKTIRLGATELGYSTMPDTANLRGAKALNDKYPPHRLNGQHTLFSYWASMYPQWSWEQVILEQTKQYAKIAYPEVEFATFYAFGFGGADGQDFWNDDQFHRLLINWQNVNTSSQTPPLNPPVAPPVSGQKVKMSSTGCTTNVRLAPNMFAKRIGVIKCHDEVDLLKRNNTGWHKIRFNGMVGYVSARHVIIQ